MLSKYAIKGLKFSTIATEKTLITDHDCIYTHLLHTCLQQCKKIQSRRLFDEMPQRLSHASKTGKIIHSQSLKLGFFLEGKLGNAILDLYAKCGNVDFAERVFLLLESRDVLTWNSVMSMYSRCGLLELVIQSLGSLRKCGVSPNQFTYAIVLSTCARLMDVGLGKQVHCSVVKIGFELNSFCEGSLIDMYAKCGGLVDARCIFDSAVNPDTVSWTAMIGGYVKIGLPEEALKIFEGLQKLGHAPDKVAFVTVISALVSLGRLDDACDLFSLMPNPNCVAWNVMISGHAQRGNEVEAVEFFKKMRKANVKATRSTFGSVLSAIANLEALHYGLLVQAQAIRQGLDSNVYVGSSLINMYAKCQKMEEAKRVFYGLEERNVVLWNSMLGGYVQNGHAAEVMKLFLDMRKCGFHPDEYSYTSILSACGNLEYSELGRQFHSYIIKNKYASNLFVGNALVDMYAKSGSLSEARQQFERIKNRDKISWNAMIVGYVQEEDENAAFNLFKKMTSDGISPDEVTLASILSACANLQAIELGKQVHCFSIKIGLETSLYTGSSLIDMYAKSGEIGAAHTVLSQMPYKSVVSMNALIGGYSRVNLEKAVILFRQMQVDEGLSPSEITFASLLDVCNGPHMVNLGMQLHCFILKRGTLFDDEFLGVSLLGMYMNSSRKRDAVTLFSELPNPKSTVLWTVIISGHSQSGFSEEALQLYREMRVHNATPDQAAFASVLKACAVSASLIDGKTTHSLIFQTGLYIDELIGSALVDMYAKCGDMASSAQVFDQMVSKRNVISWNSMIVGFAKNGYADNALQLFHNMMDLNMKPDEVTFLGVLTACSHAGQVSEGRKIFEKMVNLYKIQPRMDHCACMVDLFGRWGFLNEAEDFIDNLDFEPDAMIWANLLGACGTHGDEIRGLRAAEKLFRLEPESSASYVLLANIYAKLGDWNGANSVRRAMKEKRVRKMPGCSWINVAQKTHTFVAGDKFHINASEIYAVLDEIIVLMKDDAYVADIGSCFHGEE